MSSDTHAEEPAQGMAIDRSDVERFEQALNWAVDYRGDVTLCTADQEIECYVFDRLPTSNGGNGTIRYMTKADASRIPLSIDQVREVRFSGKDTAAGKSFDRWIQRYIEKKLAGETASIDCESLEND
ncbi:MAG: hypothetical protein P8K80_05965 [Phycisphaerales bacterium]|nr:hypothetical protein [Phycisphaerales bacterium]